MFMDKQCTFMLTDQTEKERDRQTSFKVFLWEVGKMLQFSLNSFQFSQESGRISGCTRWISFNLGLPAADPGDTTTGTSLLCFYHLFSLTLALTFPENSSCYLSIYLWLDLKLPVLSALGQGVNSIHRSAPVRYSKMGVTCLLQNLRH